MKSNGMGDPDAVDPRTGDIPTRKRRRRRVRTPVPENQRPLIDEARQRNMARPLQPGIMVEPTARGYTFRAPHDDWEAWDVLLADALGTRSEAVMRTFTRQLASLCDAAWKDEAGPEGSWVPGETELNALLALVSGMRPTNEMQAALAAQMCAVHLMQMRVAAYGLQGSRHGWIDPRTISSATRLAHTFARQAEALHFVQGGKSSRQDIHVHYHDERHVHLGGGPAQIGGQPQAPGATEGIGNVRTIEGTGLAAGIRALPSPCQDDGTAMQGPGGEGQAGLSSTRWFARFWRSIRSG